MTNWIEQLFPIIEEYRGGAVSFANDENEPLDGDEVDDLVRIIKAKINLHEGNITQQEYDEILDNREEKTRVAFKKVLFFDGGIEEINAIFIDEKQTEETYLGYAHIGQHTEIHEDFLNKEVVGKHKVSNATKEEYQDLFEELTQIGYNLEVVEL